MYYGGARLFFSSGNVVQFFFYIEGLQENTNMFTEVALTTSSTDSTSQLWDIRSGAIIFSFKQNVCPSHGMDLAPLPGYPGRFGLAISAQVDKPMINVYNFTKDQVQVKSISPEKIISIAISNRGALCAGGTEGGRVYIWEIATGALLRSFDAHYKNITVLRFTRDDSALLTASDDAVVNTWLLSTTLDPSAEDTPIPYRSWSDHTLPVTDILCGAGGLHSARALTSSLDHTCKLWDISTGVLLTTFLFPAPIVALARDWAETTLFAAGGNVVYQAELYRHREERGYAPAEVEAVGGMGQVETVGMETDSGETSSMRRNDSLIYRGHSSPVTTLALSMDASLLISGSQDGKVIVWDVASRQSIRTFEGHKGGPITTIRCFLKPPEIVLGGVGTQVKTQVMPVQQFKRLRATHDDKKDVTVPATLHNTQNDFESFTARTFDVKDLKQVHSVIAVLRQLQQESSTSKLQAQVSGLQNELIRMYEHYQSVKGLHEEGYNTLVDEFMRSRRAKTGGDENEYTMRSKKVESEGSKVGKK